MIRKYRNKAALKFGGGLILMFGGGIVAAALSYHGPNKFLDFIAVTSAIIGYMIFVFGCADLLKAKGYDSSVSLAFVLPAICCSALFIFLAPLVIMFGLKDKTKHRR